ncbi:MAG: membrane dipeptidase [Betaproteobacteria bacterium]|jgi:membrane dipeptidase|nr:membrane dipeptidase [Betaproteobacteria bacterium]
MTTTLHDHLIVIDGLNISKFDRSVFEDMRRGGVTAANCTCSIWENFRDSMDQIARWQEHFANHADLILQVRTTADIRRAKAEGRTGVFLGWQNLAGIEDRIDYLGLFKTLGVGVMQIAYNTQNLVGTGCYERHDGGLSEFGREVVVEMNRLGILCDLSHVGPNTSNDVILLSTKPVAYTHCLPSGLKAHPRNKSDEQLRYIADRGGFVGVTMFPPFLSRGPQATVDDYVDAIDYIINLIGEEQVGIGTDFTQGWGPEFFKWITHDKGRTRKLTDFGEILNPKDIRTIGEFPNLTLAMVRKGWSETRIRRVMGENWLRVLHEVWGE